MEVDVTRGGCTSSLESELYFLIAKFLADGPCGEAAEVLRRELAAREILPQRWDWLGNSHNQSFEELEKKYPHIRAQHLLQICARIGPVLEKEVPPCVPGALSLLGAGKQSLLRTKEDMAKYIRSIASFSVRQGGKPILDPAPVYLEHNLAKILQGRENSGPSCRREMVPTSFYKKIQLYRRTLGHLAAIYCILFDRSGKYIITGADDLLIKVWSSIDGRLLATFRGASGEIMDIAVNSDNTLLAAGSLDRILRVWCFQTMSPVAVLSGHSGMITSVNFCPMPFEGVNYLVSTSNDGSVAFWSYTKDENNRTVFQLKPIQYHEKMRPGQAQMICASFSPGGTFMAAGSADHHVRVYAMFGQEGPRRILEVEAHSDTVDSIQWAHTGLRFISGSKDGTADVWTFEEQRWKSKKLLMNTKLPGNTTSEDDSTKKIKVTMVCWDVSDDYVVTAVNDNSLKVWNTKTMELVKILRGHKDEVFVLESHPIDTRIIFSAGHDGQLIIWDIMNPEPIVRFSNDIEGQGPCAIFDAKWSPDGNMIAATDSHGHLMMYGYGSGVQKLKMIPKELFFHTDYRPLIRDSNNYVLDEQTQTAPHLMPPPFLVDIDGNPYPPVLQRLVPGRENLQGEQLIPNIAVGASGNQEVVQNVPEQEQPRSNIDRLIEALAQRQHIDEVDVENGDPDNEENMLRNDNVPNVVVIPRAVASPRASRAGLRREGDIEGVRQSSGNWQRDNTTPWNKPILAKPLQSSIMRPRYFKTKDLMRLELDDYNREMKRKPQVQAASLAETNGPKRKGKRTTAHGYRTRATVPDEPEEDEEQNNSTSSESNDSGSNEELSSESSSSDSSTEYSDWIADQGVNLEPPKRSKRKPVQKRPLSPSSDTERRRSKRPVKKVVVPDQPPRPTITEVPEIFRPPEWLSSTIPRKTPYYPQMGDEIVYFRQGHQAYLEAVRNKNVYELNRYAEPWQKLDLKAQEFVKVIGIKYEIRPPRLCCLKLRIIDEDGQLTKNSFTIKYHDMLDVLDFLVLKQTFDTALNRNWSEGDRFRCIIDDAWWIGEIMSVEPADENFPDSYFMCFRVRWDNGEMEKMSPWDLEPIDENRVPEILGSAVPVLPEEIREILYQPQKGEWPSDDREAVCRRIIRGLDEVMTLSVAEPFVAPVDLNSYPDYAIVIEYPIDLSTIKARFESFFYRRILAAQFDVRYLATNAEQYNEPHSVIVKKARIVTELCLKILTDIDDTIDVTALYHQINDTYHSTTDSEVEVEDINEPSTSSQKRRKPPTKKKPAIKEINTGDWKTDCRGLLETLWQCEDSLPFREPVDELEHPDYHRVIDTPMDLMTVREELLGGNYESPLAFAKDMKLIFENSRNFNTNKRSKIFTMTVRLSNMFESLIARIISNWKSAQRRKTNDSKKSGKSKSRPKTGIVVRHKPSPRKCTSNGPGSSKMKIETTDDDEDEDEEHDFEMDQDDTEVEEETLATPKKRNMRSSDEFGSSKITNGHSSRLANLSQHSLRTRSTTKSYKSLKESETESSMSESSDDEKAKKRSIRNTRSCRNLKLSNGHSESSDSESEPSPTYKGKQTRTLRIKNSKNSRPSRSKRKNYNESNNDEDDEEDEENESEESQDKDPLRNTESESEEEPNPIRPKVRNNMVLSSENEKSQNENDEEESNHEQTQDDSDYEDEEEKDEDDSRSPKSRRPVRKVNNKTPLHHSRRTNLKRPRYRELSEDDTSDDGIQPNSRRAAKRPNYEEDSEDDSQSEFPLNSSSEGPSKRITISRSGRVCKPTPKVLALQ